MTIAYLGPQEQTFGYEAAKLWRRPNQEYVALRSHLHILEAVEAGEIAEGIVAIENSIQGTVTDVLDYFIHNAQRARVCGEVVVPINQCLFGRPGTSLQEVRQVISHPQALGQCARNIYQQFPEAEQVAAESTGAAVQKMLESEVPAIAIAGKTGVRDGAVLLQENFQDAATNATRFWVVSQECPGATSQDKTSLAFETFENAPGALFAIYAIFASRGLNLSKSESRPNKQALGGYVFLMDVEAHQEDPSLKDALEKASLCTPKLRVFGSYPRWQNGV